MSVYWNLELLVLTHRFGFLCGYLKLTVTCPVRNPYLCNNATGYCSSCSTTASTQRKKHRASVLVGIP